MHIFVINLERDIARRNSISAQLDELGLAYEILPAVYGANLSGPELSAVYDDRKSRLHRARSLLSAEVGCALSHLMVYRAIVEREIEYALVLEDDVILPKNLKEFLSEFEQHCKAEIPTVWLLSPGKGDEASSGSFGFCELYRFLPYLSGFYTSSYVLTLTAATSLLAELYPVADVADCWQRLDRYKVVNIYVASPPLIEQNQLDFGSSTTDDYQKNLKMNYFRRAEYKVLRLRAIVWGLVYGPYRRWFRPYCGLKFGTKK